MPILKRLVAVVFTLLIGLPATAAEAKLDVVATLGDLGAVTEQVGGEHVEVTVLAAPQEDPHFVDPKPSYVSTVGQADLVVVNGMSLEVGWLPTLLENSRNGAVQNGQDGHFDASTVVEKMGVPDTEVTRSMGDVHPEGNPHYTLDPRQMARVSIGLGERLGNLDPDHEEKYKKRARAFAKRCLKVARKWEEKFASLEDDSRKVVIYHEAWDYVLDWLDLQKVTTVEPKPGVEPNPSQVADVIKAIERDSVRAILRMEYYPGSTVSNIADKTDATVVTSDGQTREGEDYIDRVDQLAQKLYDVLS